MISLPSDVPYPAVSVRAAGERRVRDPGPAAHAAQPGDPVRVSGSLRGGGAALQAGARGPGEDLGT